MIITCEKCDTRFKLDDARIPADGVKVRCSRCKNAFRVVPPQPEGASDADLADALAREAVARKSDVDDCTQTLGSADEHEDHTQVLDHGAVDLTGSRRSSDEPEEESDWEFNEDPDEVAAEAASTAAPRVEAPVELAGAPPPKKRPAPPPVADPMNEFLASEPGVGADAADASLADLGSPEDWDLLGPDDGPRAPSEPAPALDAELEHHFGAIDADGSSESLAGTGAEAEADSPAIHDIAPELTQLRLDVGPPSLAARAKQLGVWAAVAGLLLVAAWGSLRTQVPLLVPLTGAELGALQATDVRASVVENALAGPLLVVSGRVRNPQAGPRMLEGALRVRLVDGSGAALAGAEAWLARAPTEADLREQAPQDLLVAQALRADSLARTPLAPGESLPVAAVFAAIPSEARGFRLEVVERLSSEAFRPSPLPASE